MSSKPRWEFGVHLLAPDAGSGPCSRVSIAVDLARDKGRRSIAANKRGWGVRRYR
jgi:hypothetical protein